MKKTILTGLRVNSELTLGNYLGAMLPMVRLANKYSETMNVNIFVPDLHSIISEVDGNLKENTLRSIKYYLAAGLSPRESVHVYRQSQIPAHTSLTWVLNCTATMGEMSRMTQYKDKSNGKESTNVGIFDYPVLMAADILLYDANYVPVGEDQFQHLELTRNLAERFNHKYGEIFTVPENTKTQVEFMGQQTGIRIRDLVNPEKKMSKSSASENSKIMLSDDPKKAAKKIMSATTDSFGSVKFDVKERPGISNLLQIEALINNRPLEDVVEEWEGCERYGDLKKKVAESVENLLTDFQDKYREISDDQAETLLIAGEKYAKNLAEEKLNKVYEKLGLV
ncbi:tryptophan--tRNA ligase [Candidatus Saccharibacteria bacterium]|nr:tryptophan--tRNA ligase [Candidatus Saccharibacteria bacterium]